VHSGKDLARGLARRVGVRRIHVSTARLFCERAVLAARRSREVRSTGRILCYHSVGQRFMGVNDVAPERFREQIRWALDQGYQFVPAAEIARTGGNPKHLAITFDDATSSVLSNALPILREFGVPATVFVVTSWADHEEAWQRESFLGWQGIDDLRAAGVEIGSHSVTHPDFSKLNESQAVFELQESRRALEQRVGEVDEFAIPFGQSANWSSDMSRLAKDCGYTTLYAQAETTKPVGTVPRTFVTRFDNKRIFQAALGGAFDRWEEWY
jgi:peptidoglycan/xylan/chitin deacetylase (PgdA/CDA1 family)